MPLNLPDLGGIFRPPPEAPPPTQGQGMTGLRSALEIYNTVRSIKRGKRQDKREEAADAEKAEAKKVLDSGTSPDSWTQAQLALVSKHYPQYFGASEHVKGASGERMAWDLLNDVGWGNMDRKQKGMVAKHLPQVYQAEMAQDEKNRKDYFRQQGDDAFERMIAAGGPRNMSKADRLKAARYIPDVLSNFAAGEKDLDGLNEIDRKNRLIQVQAKHGIGVTLENVLNNVDEEDREQAFNMMRKDVEDYFKESGEETMSGIFESMFAGKKQGEYVFDEDAMLGLSRYNRMAETFVNIYGQARSEMPYKKSKGVWTHKLAERVAEMGNPILAAHIEATDSPFQEDDSFADNPTAERMVRLDDGRMLNTQQFSEYLKGNDPGPPSAAGGGAPWLNRPVAPSTSTRAVQRGAGGRSGAVPSLR